MNSPFARDSQETAHIFTRHLLLRNSLENSGRSHRSFSKGQRSSSRNREFERKANNISVINDRINGLLDLVGSGRSNERNYEVETRKPLNLSRTRESPRMWEYSMRDQEAREGVLAIKYTQSISRAQEQSNKYQQSPNSYKSQRHPYEGVQQTSKQPISTQLRRKYPHPQEAQKSQKPNGRSVTEWWQNLLDQMGETQHQPNQSVQIQNQPMITSQQANQRSNTIQLSNVSSRTIKTQQRNQINNSSANNPA